MHCAALFPLSIVLVVCCAQHPGYTGQPAVGSALGHSQLGAGGASADRHGDEDCGEGGNVMYSYLVTLF